MEQTLQKPYSQKTAKILSKCLPYYKPYSYNIEESRYHNDMKIRLDLLVSSPISDKKYTEVTYEDLVNTYGYLHTSFSKHQYSSYKKMSPVVRDIKSLLSNKKIKINVSYINNDNPELTGTCPIIQFTSILYKIFGLNLDSELSKIELALSGATLVAVENALSIIHNKVLQKFLENVSKSEICNDDLKINDYIYSDNNDNVTILDSTVKKDDVSFTFRLGNENITCFTFSQDDTLFIRLPKNRIEKIIPILKKKLGKLYSNKFATTDYFVFLIIKNCKQSIIDLLNLLNITSIYEPEYDVSNYIHIMYFNKDSSSVLSNKITIPIVNLTQILFPEVEKTYCTLFSIKQQNSLTKVKYYLPNILYKTDYKHSNFNVGDVKNISLNIRIHTFFKNFFSGKFYTEKTYSTDNEAYNPFFCKWINYNFDVNLQRYSNRTEWKNLLSPTYLETLSKVSKLENSFDKKNPHYLLNKIFTDILEIDINDSNSLKDFDLSKFEYTLHCILKFIEFSFKREFNSLKNSVLSIKDMYIDKKSISNLSLESIDKEDIYNLKTIQTACLDSFIGTQTNLPSYFSYKRSCSDVPPGWKSDNRLWKHRPGSLSNVVTSGGIMAISEIIVYE